MSTINTTVINITTAQIKTLKSAPVTIVPAQGPNIVILPVMAVFQLKAGAPFNLPMTLVFYLGSAGLSSFGSACNFDLSVDQLSQDDGGLATLGQKSSYINQPLLFSSTIDIGNAGSILTTSLNAALNSLYKVGDTGTIDMFSGTSPGDATYSITSVTNSFPVVAVNQGTKTFSIVGNHAGAFSPTDLIQVYGSTGNDAVYTVFTSTFSSPNTNLVVVEAIPSAVTNGALGNQTTDPNGTVGHVATYTITNAGTHYNVKATNVTAATSGLGIGLTIDINTVTLIPATGTGKLMVKWYQFECS